MAKTTEQVWAERQDAIRTLNLDKLMEGYAPDAMMLYAGKILQGREQIRPLMEGVFKLLGVPTSAPEVTIAGDVIMVVFSMRSPFASITDGVDVFVVREGFIQYHASHVKIVMI
jgi:ketosteroid isomerase-like protein